MNFMGGSRQSEGRLYEDDSSKGTHPFSTFSSSPGSSSNQEQQQMIGRLVPLSRGPWDDETTASFRGGGGVGGAGPSHQLDLMMMDSSSSPTKDNNDLVLDSPSGGGGSPSSAAVASAEAVMIEKEHMFDKVVTPSDVGKLNRLVIPKQQAEKYFPLDSTTNEKGLLLNFEDRNGKPWRFRYSYWNSSQSYVMTKGWSRFVKEKKLDAGDVVSFLRGVGDLGRDRLFIDWRRRPDAPGYHHNRQFPHQFSFHHPPWNHQPLYLQQQQIPWGNFRLGSGPIIYSRSQRPQQQVGFGINQRGSEAEDQPVVFESVPVVVEGKAAGKRLRLFGVNMDCPMSESEEDHYCVGVPSATATHSSQQYVSHLEFRPYNYGNPIIQTTMPTQSHLNNTEKTSMSLDLNI